jgi:FtsH-binding integral membrane protein
MRKQWYEKHYLLEGVMLAVAAINGWLAYAFGSQHPIMAFLHAVMAVAMVLAVVFCWKLDTPS